MIVYACPPIDNGWHKLQTVYEFAKTLGGEEAEYRARHSREDSDPEFTVADFLDAWEEAKSLASTRNWEGDFRHDPCVFLIPNETGFDYGFVFKQDNNGTTFIVTPVRMPWIERFALE